ncbi:hypothetical protein GALL_120950 [mine drainage metagenome]|uniref:Uncharacterized protein n=1 Tax=mine drainage metagenome TaxID=410659 RepID=A0A1J5SNJ3_9ZZZZ
MHDHAFDHLSDEKLNRIRQSFKRLSDSRISLRDRTRHQNELLDLCSEADLFTETTSQQSLQQWYAVMNCFGLNGGRIDATEEDAE